MACRWWLPTIILLGTLSCRTERNNYCCRAAQGSRTICRAPVLSSFSSSLSLYIIMCFMLTRVSDAQPAQQSRVVIPGASRSTFESLNSSRETAARHRPCSKSEGRIFLDIASAASLRQAFRTPRLDRESRTGTNAKHERSQPCKYLRPECPYA